MSGISQHLLSHLLAGFIFMHPRLINMGYIGNALARAVGARKEKMA